MVGVIGFSFSFCFYRAIVVSVIPGSSGVCSSGFGFLRWHLQTGNMGQRLVYI